MVQDAPGTRGGAGHRYRGLPLVASTADLERDGGFRAQDRLFVADRVVAGVVRRAALRSGLVEAVVDVTLRLEPGPGGDRCVGARVDVTVPYGAPVPVLVDDLRPLLAAALADVLGPAERAVDVHVVDVQPLSAP